MNRKEFGIDIMKLYAEGSANKWNKFLTNCKKHHDLEALKKVYYGIQVGMTDLAKKKLNTEKVSILFVRMQKSLENTAKEILKEKFPSPNDNPLTATKEHLENKRKRDAEFQAWLKKVRF